jgi:hypothetical protein
MSRNEFRLTAVALAMLAAAGLAVAAPPYEITKVLVAQDQFKANPADPKLKAAPLFKPHDSRTSLLPRYWITSNERTGCAGITVFANGSDAALATLFIDDPEATFPPDESSSAPPCVGKVEPPPPPETGEETEPPEGTPPVPEDQFPAELRFNPTLCLPVVLPPGQTSVPYDVVIDEGGNRATGTVKSPGPGLVCAPLGAEKHARHPHGISVYYLGSTAYQVIEHSGLRWNADRTRFEVAITTDEESGMTLAYDVRNPAKPKILKAYLNGHGAHELVVNQRNGLVFQGNHEDSPGVNPPIWVDVINPRLVNPYGFIDTGFFNAIQGIDVNGEVDDIAGIGEPDSNVVYGTTHVGEKMFAFDGACRPKPNPADVVPPPAPPGYTLPAGDKGMKMGWNCILWWVDIRPAFLKEVPNAEAILAIGQGAKPNVLHFHNLAANPLNHKAYQTIHSIHEAEHTGLPGDEPPPSAEGEEEEVEHVMGRWVAEVGVPSSVDPKTKKGNAAVHIIDLSHGFDALTYPTVEDILTTDEDLGTLLSSFVHAHFIAVDPLRQSLLVTGEHTGNLGVVDPRSRKLERVIPISKKIPGCTPPVEIDPVTGEPIPASPEEPHVHGVTVQPILGTVYVADEGEHCFYESMTILRPYY